MLPHQFNMTFTVFTGISNQSFPIKLSSIPLLFYFHDLCTDVDQFYLSTTLRCRLHSNLAICVLCIYYLLFLVLGTALSIFSTLSIFLRNPWSNNGSQLLRMETIIPRTLFIYLYSFLDSLMSITISLMFTTFHACFVW